MKIKEQTIKKIQEMTPDEATWIYNIIQSMGKKAKTSKTREKAPPYKRSRIILSKCEDSLAKDIISNREDRI